MKTIITIQHTQSVHHTNGMVGSWTDWELSELGVAPAEKIGEKLKTELAGRNFVMYSSDLLGLDVEAINTCELFGLAGGVSYMFVNDEGKRFVKRISDMSYLA